MGLKDLIKKNVGKKDQEIELDCAPKLEMKTGKLNETSLNQKIFMMFYQIKHSGLENALVHLDSDFTEWWEKYWKEYDLNVHKKKLMTRLTNMLTNEFSIEERNVLAQSSDFNLSGVKDTQKGSVLKAGTAGNMNKPTP